MLSSESNAFHYGNLLLADVVYSDDEEKYKSELSEVESKISVYLEDFFMHKLQGKQEVPGSTGEAIGSFLSCITLYKHQGFKEEQEVRIVSMPFALNKHCQEELGEEYCKSKLEKSRELRDKNGKRTPYIELFKSLPTPLPIEKIIVGPHKDKESRAAELRIMLRNTDIKVTVSAIPYQDRGKS